MKRCNCKLIWWGLLYAALTAIYVFLVAWLLQSGEKLFGKETQVLGVIAVLMLLVFSASVVGSLIFGRPIILLFAKEWKKALWQLVLTMAWLLVILIVVFLFLI